MRKYEILQATTFKAGRFKLTDEQFRRRRHVTRLIDAESQIVEPNPDISFKRGEIIETDLTMAKGATVRPIDDLGEDRPNVPSATAAGSGPVAGSTEAARTEQPAASDDPMASVDVDQPSVAPTKGRTRR